MPVCSGDCDSSVPTQACTTPPCAVSASCDVVVGFGSATGLKCKAIKINSQGLIFNGGQVVCPN